MSQLQQLGRMVKVGTVFVDAGMVMIGDPCYVLGDDASHRQTSWQDVCTKIMDPKSQVADSVTEPLGKGIALFCSSGHGDGEYPVYVTMNDDGVPSSLTVVFDDPNTNNYDDGDAPDED